MASVIRQESANRYQQIVSELYAGGVIALFTVLACLSFGPLIFHGELSSCVSQGIGVGLISAVVVGGIISLRSSYAGTIAIPQDRTAPILGLMATQIASQLPEASAIETKCVTILFTIGLTSVLAGIILYLLGKYRLGNLVRFIPYPVIGGFLAGSGWLLVRGGAQVMTGMPFSFANLDRQLEGPSLAKLVLGAGLGTAMFLAARKLRRPLIVPRMLVAAILIFYALMGVSGHSIAQARAGGWLVELSPGADFLPQLWNLQVLAAVQWTSLIGVVGIAGTVLLTAIISILLNSGGLELVVHQEIDFNKELEVAGSANIVAGLGGGMLGFQSLSLSRLAYELGARTRLTGLVAVSICAAVFLIGPSPLSYLPNLVLGGLLFYLGLGFLVEWVFDSRSKLPMADYAVVLLILAVVGSAGYMQGVAVGILAAVFLFIHNYSRVGIITHALTGAERQSNVDRPLMHQRFLLELGAQTYVLKLQGFLFFGTANGLLNDIRNRLQDTTLAPLRFVVLDFRRVSGLDSSATVSLLKAQRLAEQSGFYLVLTSLPDHVYSQLKKAGFQSERDGSCKLFRDLDHGIEDLLVIAPSNDLKA